MRAACGQDHVRFHYFIFVEDGEHGAALRGVVVIGIIVLDLLILLFFECSLVDVMQGKVAELGRNQRNSVELFHLDPVFLNCL